MEEIKKELLELKFNVNSIGIIYWVEAIKVVKNNPLVWNMHDIYEQVANTYLSTPSKVERAMRHSIEPAKKNIQNEYGYYGKIRNETFLALIRYKLI